MQRFRQCCALTLIALAPLALVSTASAAFTNRSASSGTMTMSGYAVYSGESSGVLDTAQSVLPSSWANSNSQWNLEQTSNPNNPQNNPRLTFDSWQADTVSARATGANPFGGSLGIDWSISSLRLNFSVTSDDLCEISTQNISGSFAADFWQQVTPGGEWINRGMWGNLGATKVFAVQTGSTYQLSIGYANSSWDDSIFEMHLTGSGAPAPGALALIGMAGIFGGRRRRSSSRMDAQ